MMDAPLGRTSRNVAGHLERAMILTHESPVEQKTCQAGRVGSR
jgi:hypothetical protein